MKTLNAAQTRILAAVSESGGMTMAELTMQTGYSMPHVNRHVRLLWMWGRLTRERCERGTFVYRTRVENEVIHEV